jgi:uncharacterized protein (DUF58 family)
MSWLLPPEIRRELGRSRVNTRGASASVGVGERRSRDVGAGLEFADFRSYQPGDDIRYLDRHVHARLGHNVVRQFAVDRQLDVTILVDVSASMQFGSPSKLTRALEIGAALVYAAARAGDRVRVGAARAGGVTWHSSVQGARRIGELLAWMETLDARGNLSFGRLAARTIGGTHTKGMLVVISDWLDQDAPKSLSIWGSAWSEVIAVQVLAPEEVAPSWESGRRPSELEDAETGERLPLDSQDDDQRYRDALRAWQTELAAGIQRHAGRWFSFTTSESVIDALREMRIKGLIG